MALSCAQCIESGHLTARSDPLLESSASVSVSAGGSERGEQRRPEQAGGVIRQDFKTIAIDHILKLSGALGRKTQDLVQDTEVWTSLER